MVTKYRKRRCNKKGRDVTAPHEILQCALQVLSKQSGVLIRLDPRGSFRLKYSGLLLLTEYPNVFELLAAGGWLIWPIIICSIVALAIIVDKFRHLSTALVMPTGLYDKIEALVQDKKLTNAHLTTLADQSPLGKIFSTAISNAHFGKSELKASVEDSGRHQVHEMEKYLGTLGSIAAITPLLGLLGTVVGMIKVFAAITAVGIGQPQELAEGISQALITTAAGLTVAIPSLLFFRHFKTRIESLSINMEREVLRLFALIDRTKASDTQGSVNQATSPATKQTDEK